MLLCPWDSAGKNTGMGCHALLTQGLNPFPVYPWLLVDSLPMRHWGSPKLRVMFCLANILRSLSFDLQSEILGCSKGLLQEVKQGSQIYRSFCKKDQVAEALKITGD